MKTKVAQYVERERVSERVLLVPSFCLTFRHFFIELSYQNKTCSECQQDVRKIERQAGIQTDRQIFQLSYQNKTCSECQQDVKKSVRQSER